MANVPVNKTEESGAVRSNVEVASLGREGPLFGGIPLTGLDRDGLNHGRMRISTKPVERIGRSFGSGGNTTVCPTRRASRLDVARAG